MEAITTRYPYRVNFAGGLTDLEDYYLVHGGAVVASALDLYACASITRRSDDAILVSQKSLGIHESGSTRNLEGISKFYRVVIEHFTPESGFELVLDNVLKYGSGLGSSSASLLSMIDAFCRLSNVKMGKGEMADLAFSMETKGLGVHAGKQDPYVSAYGGFDHVEFSSSAVKVNRLDISRTQAEEINNRMLVVNAGMRKSHSQLWQVIENIRRSDKETLSHLDAIKDCALKMLDAVRSGSVDDMGQIMTEDWRNKAALTPGISNRPTEAIFDAAMRHGADGGKLLGAGNGGHFVFMCTEKGRPELIDSLRHMGLDVSTPKLESNQ